MALKATVALIRPLVWDPPYAAGTALKSKKKKKNKKQKNKKTNTNKQKCFLALVLRKIYRHLNHMEAYHFHRDKTGISLYNNYY